MTFTSMRFFAITCSAAALASAFAACGNNVILDRPNTGNGAGGPGGAASPSGVGGGYVPPAVGGGTSLGGRPGFGGSGPGLGGGETGFGGAGPAAVTSTVTVGPTTSVASSTASTSVGSSSGSVCSSTTAPQGPCSPHASCPSAASPCLATAPQNGAPKFGLRMSQLTMTAPKAFVQGIVATTVENAVMPNDAVCNLAGTGTFSWLLQFDTNAGTLTTGGAAPSQNGYTYSFVDKTIWQSGTAFQVQPVTLSAPFAGCSVDSSKGDVTLPMFLDASGSQAVLLPMHGLSFQGGSVSGDHSCIGVYNAGGLDPANSCQPDVNHHAFLDGASVHSYMVLEETDTVLISALNMSLCVLLSGNTSMYGTSGPNGEQVCKRNASGQIVFQGDWCSTTDAPAAGACADSVQFNATFAASGVSIK